MKRRIDMGTMENVVMTWNKFPDIIPPNGRHVIATVSVTNFNTGEKQGNIIEFLYMWNGQWYSTRDEMSVNSDVIAWMYYPSAYTE
jgi:hypothetical protein